MSALKRFVIFYSWQSDVDEEANRRLIREGLRAASSRLEAEYASERLHVEIDEATRNVPGSPNIPLTIFDKIRSADAFVSDVTTINQDRKPDTRACPNPNVLLELGYAAAHLGWSRELTASLSEPTDLRIEFVKGNGYRAIRLG